MGRWDDTAEDTPDDWRGWKDGKYDNRYGENIIQGSYKNNQNKKRLKNVGIGIGVIIVGLVFLFVLGIFEIDDLKKISDEINLPPIISEFIEYSVDSLVKARLAVENIIRDNPTFLPISHIKIPEIQIPEIEIPSFEPPEPPSLHELRQITLDDINKYRKNNKVGLITLGNAKAPQVYAEQLAQERCIHHVSNSGDGPMLRYKNNNDKMYLISENLAGGYGSIWNMEQAILDANYDMMFDDAHANWGHRDNIINPDHESVSIGITFDSNELVIVQDFEQSLGPGYLYQPGSFEKEAVDEKSCW